MSKIQMRGLTEFATRDNQLVTAGKLFWIDSGEGDMLKAEGKATAELLPRVERKAMPTPSNKMRQGAANK